MDIQTQISQLQQQVADLAKMVNALNSHTTMPINVEAAIRERVINDSAQTATPFVQTLSSTPGGVIVPNQMDGFFELKPGLLVPFYYNK